MLIAFSSICSPLLCSGSLTHKCFILIHDRFLDLKVKVCFLVSCLLPLLTEKWTCFIDVLCMILWFLRKLMLFCSEKHDRSQSGWVGRVLWRTSGPATTTLYFTGTGIGCVPGVQRSISVYAASRVSLFTPLCQPWCLPVPIVNSLSTVIWQVAYTNREEADLAVSALLKLLGPGGSRKT